jgi:hypothetical protein
MIPTFPKQRLNHDHWYWHVRPVSGRCHRALYASWLILIGVRVVFAAAIVGLLGLVELRGWGQAAGIVGTIPH